MAMMILMISLEVHVNCDSFGKTRLVPVWKDSISTYDPVKGMLAVCGGLIDWLMSCVFEGLGKVAGSAS